MQVFYKLAHGADLLSQRLRRDLYLVELELLNRLLFLGSGALCLSIGGL